MASVGEIALGAFLQVVFDKLASPEMLYFFRRESIRTQVMNWEKTLREIRAVLDDAEEKQITSKLVNLWLEELQDLAYDLDDLLDEFSTEALCEMIEKSQSTTNKIRAYFRTFMRLNLGWEDWCPYVGETEVRAFPCLIELSIKRCPELVSLFKGEEERQEQQQMKGLSFMMRLESLKLQDCKKLEKLPRWLHTFPFLGELKISFCPSLVSFPEKALKYIISPRGGLPSTLKHLTISMCGMLESLVAEEGMKINCPSLESFEINCCWNLKFLPDALYNDDNNLKNLRRFKIQGLHSLESIPEGWFSLPTNLREICIFSNKKLDALPHSLQNNINFRSLAVLQVGSLRTNTLKKISFDRFFSLETLSILNPILEEEEVELSVFPIEWMSLPTSLIQLTLDGFPYLETLCSRQFQKLTSLQKLSIRRCPRLASVPKEGLPPSLQELYIDYCAEFTSILEQGLPQSLLYLYIGNCPKFGSFPEEGLPQSLLRLVISSCPNLGSFPEQGLPLSLLVLYVLKCPILKRLCEKGKGKYWDLIRHIPEVTIDNRSIFDT
ncbi:hypothetical protein Acr_14g0000570 [Actinidia rufa]|uniref:Disease resistance N-terminal domain-containing protein n=1 Tax=Actinidia rufa TaxID=165716 RepID=A0A7J0FP46_9ERIC|nr:hypothetical protein Acr_14g0000570 [Actinidia rufa]